MTTSEHIDPSIAPANLADMEGPDEGDIPEGAVRFEITAEEVAEAIAAESLEVRQSVQCVFILLSSAVCFDITAEQVTDDIPATSMNKQCIFLLVAWWHVADRSDCC